MGKIIDYEKITAFDTSNVFLIDGDSGTKTILASKVLEALVGMSRGELHRNIYGGRNLGTFVSSAQLAAIQNGTFKDMLVGDYWVINGVKWLIADMDYWYNCGDTAFTKHHLVIIPETPLYTAQMNSTNTTNGGYVGSTMHVSGLDTAKATINTAFSNMVLTHREYLVNAVSNGKPSGGAWYDSTVELPNECMVYGHSHFTPTNDGSTIPNLYTIGKSQLALFMLKPSAITTRSSSYWLRDVVSSADFAGVGYDGHAGSYHASYSLGVRPVFAIG